MASQRNSGIRALRKTPFPELLTIAVIITSDAAIAQKPRIISDALFIEGVVFSLIGTIIALRISDQFTLLPSQQEKQDATTRTRQRFGSLTSILVRRNGLRILLVGLILTTAAIVIGELLVRSAT